LFQRQWGRGEGHPTADRPAPLQARRPSSPQPSPRSEGGEGEKSAALNPYSQGQFMKLRNGARTPRPREPIQPELADEASALLHELASLQVDSPIEVLISSVRFA